MSVRRILRFARPYRGMLAALVLLLFVEAVLGIIPPLLFRAVIDDALPAVAGAGGDGTLLAVLAAGAVAAALAETGVAFLARWLSARLSGGVVYDLRVAVFEHVQRLPLDFFARTRTGALTNRLNNDVVGAQSALTDTLTLVVSNSIVLATTLVAMLTLEWRSTLCALAVLPVFVVPVKRVGRRLQAVLRDQMNAEAAMSATMTERFSVPGASLVKLFGRGEDERDGFARRADSVRSTWVRTAVYAGSFYLALGLVAATATAAIYWIAGRQVIDGAVSKGTLVALAAMIPPLYGSLAALTNARVDLMTSLVSFERIFEVLDAPNPLADDGAAVDLAEVRGDVAFTGVWFRYPSEPTVRTLELDPDVARSTDGDRARANGGYALQGVDLTIDAGQTVALVGRSGSGKTTIAQLVPRLYDVTSGAVRVDGTDVRRLTQASLRRAIGVVSQDPYLFHASIADNLRYASPGAADAELERACRAAHIHHVIAALPDGYATVVGDHGHKLSGGERQRLAIARVLLKDPAIVILDEATSQLDSESEALVHRALARATLGRTSIVIAHRLSTLTHADRIFVIDGGRITEEGRHSELMARGGLYSDLYRTLLDVVV